MANTPKDTLYNTVHHNNLQLMIKTITMNLSHKEIPYSCPVLPYHFLPRLPSFHVIVSMKILKEVRYLALTIFNEGAYLTFKF